MKKSSHQERSRPGANQNEASSPTAQLEAAEGIPMTMTDARVMPFSKAGAAGTPLSDTNAELCAQRIAQDAPPLSIEQRELLSKLLGCNTALRKNRSSAA